MKFTYDIQDGQGTQLPEENTFLSTNGLGGYCSLSAAGSVTRCDQGLLISAERSPNLRITLVHRLRDRLITGKGEYFLSSQSFSDGSPREQGCMQSFSYETYASWQGNAGDVEVKKSCAAAYGENQTALCYEVINRSSEPCTLVVEPMLKMAPKEAARQESCGFSLEGNRVTGDGWTLFTLTDGEIRQTAPRWEHLSYPDDAKDGRPGEGLAGSCFEIRFQIPAGQQKHLEIVFSQKKTENSASGLLKAQEIRLLNLAESCGLQNPVGQQLAMAADAYISHRDSTGGKTILAGYPLFSDWGRDTMIALRGCCLAAKRFEDARSILRTFMTYEKDGLMPNLFPEGGEAPMYNTVDAALLFIDSIWQYYSRTEDLAFVQEAWPVMTRIVDAYRRGTKHGIHMEEDGLIAAGEGFDQVTWMDVRIGDILPTPRHGKPVEINAYWYNALKILEAFSGKLGLSGEAYGTLAEKVKESFLKAFYIPEKGYLRDVISGTGADDQIRCNQIWAVSMAFTMLNPQQERAVVDTVSRHLFTDHGLRSLSPEDREYHPHYGGDQLNRDLAYHQGTVWVFPLGAFYLAYLRTMGKAGAAQVRSWLSSMEPMLREGCAGQLPEIYDGDNPREGKGCFAQAWSVGEMLMVYEALEAMERKE